MAVSMHHRTVGRSLSSSNLAAPPALSLHAGSSRCSTPTGTPPSSPRGAARSPSPFLMTEATFAMPQLDRLCVIAAAQKRDYGASYDAWDEEPAAPRSPEPTSLDQQPSYQGSLDLSKGLYLEPLLRSLVLGISAGALTEVLHVFFTAVQYAGRAGGLFMLPAVLPMAAKAMEPLFWVDHAVALGVWALLYAWEAKTITSVLGEHRQDPIKGVEAVRRAMPLPKRMLPVSMTSARRAFFKAWTGKGTATATAASGTSGGAGAAGNNANAFTTGDFARELQRRERGNAPGGGAASGGSAGTATVDRPRPATRTPDADVDKSPAPAPESGDVDSLEAALAAPPATKPPPPAKAVRLPRTLKPLKSPKPPTQPPSQQEPESQESKRERELRERKAYLKNFWYAAGLSSSLKSDKPMEVKIMGRTVVLFRDENGKVACMENLCAHRGAPLGQGKVKKVDGHNCVVCPYHAWAFDKEGKLADVPTQVNGGLPKRSMQETYPVEERGGFIWLFFGSKSMPAEERPPIPCIPELEDPKWQAVYGEMEFESPHWSTFDNALDMAHIHYVHNGSFGNPNKPEILDMNVERDAFGLKGSFKIHNKPVNKLWEWTRVPHVPVELKAFLPMTSAVRITLGHGIQMITFVNTVPIDENRSINRFCLIRNFATSPLMDTFVEKEMMKILAEDKVMVETVVPEQLPHEYSLAADIPQVAFRKLRQEWVDMGYAVDPSKTTGPHGSLNM